MASKLKAAFKIADLCEKLIRTNWENKIKLEMFLLCIHILQHDEVAGML
jgi:hypothetical protein